MLKKIIAELCYERQRLYITTLKDGPDKIVIEKDVGAEKNGTGTENLWLMGRGKSTESACRAIDVEFLIRCIANGGTSRDLRV